MVQNLGKLVIKVLNTRSGRVRGHAFRRVDNNIAISRQSVAIALSSHLLVTNVTTIDIYWLNSNT